MEGTGTGLGKSHNQIASQEEPKDSACSLQLVNQALSGAGKNKVSVSILGTRGLFLALNNKHEQVGNPVATLYMGQDQHGMTWQKKLRMSIKHVKAGGRPKSDQSNCIFLKNSGKVTLG